KAWGGKDQEPPEPPVAPAHPWPPLGCWAGAGAVTGPRSVRGPPGGSVAVRCQYQTGYEEDPKYWCRVREVFWSCSKDHLAKTSRAEAEVKWGRVSIRDNRTERVFTVTVENLTLADAGDYYCGIGKDRRLNPMATVTLIVSPGKSRPCSQLAPASLPSTDTLLHSGPDSTSGHRDVYLHLNHTKWQEQKADKVHKYFQKKL
uniref:Ig-like domain-containing protein n=1 Tax=Pelusios castaneus TaxID=367368 RepID=A0A8C8SB01_9SAUR